MLRTTSRQVKLDELTVVAVVDCEPLFSDIAALLDGTLPEPPKPVVLQRTDRNALFYRGRHNVLFGDSEDGKTWITLAACTETLCDGGTVLFIDLDHNRMQAIAANLVMLGAPVEALASQQRFRHCEPDDARSVLNVVAACLFWRPDLVVVDSMKELMPLLGADSNSADDYTNTVNRIIVPFTNIDVCVIDVDHLAKASDSRAYGAGGTMAKRRTPGGASIRVKKGRQLTPGKGGAARLFVHKDRHGGLRKHCPPGHEQDIGTFVMDEPNENGCVGWRITLPLTMLGDIVTDLDTEALQYLEAANACGDNGFDEDDLLCRCPVIRVPVSTTWTGHITTWRNYSTRTG